MKKLAFLFVCMGSLFCSGIDIICSSFNRPMQLYALLESIEKNVSGHDKIFVICRSDLEYVEGYSEVQKAYPEVKFYYQGTSKKEAYACFKPMMLGVLFDESVSMSDYCVFAVDDIIVFDKVDLQHGKEALASNDKFYGFYYRLGRNIFKQNYTQIRYNGVPKMKAVGLDVFSWEFKDGKGDWGYPNTVDFTLYRKCNLKSIFSQLDYQNPNTLEGKWAGYRPTRRIGLCHKRSKIVNIPMNCVNESWTNRTIGDYSTSDLNGIFMSGKKIDITIVEPKKVETAHQNFAYRFIDR